MTTFYRLLKDTDKAAALRTAVAARRSGDTDPDRTFTVDPAAFSKVPNTPFAYWVDDEIRDLFLKLPPFESEGRTVKQGLATADDFRFVRAWWEVDPARRLDPGLGGAPDWREDLEGFQVWCRRRTHEGKGWAPFAKGGEYSPYYSDIHLVVNWEREGEEIKNFVNPETGKQNSRPQNTDYYFRPGVTWPARPHKRGGFSAIGAGALFSTVGTMVFAPPEQFNWLLRLLNSDAYIGLLHLLMPRGTGDTGQTLKYEIGYVKSVPLPPFGGGSDSIHDGSVAALTTKKRKMASVTDEVSPVAETVFYRQEENAKIAENSIAELNRSATADYD
nr:hypothetical protein [Spirochaeta sp.]